MKVWGLCSPSWVRKHVFLRLRLPGLELKGLNSHSLCSFLMSSSGCLLGDSDFYPVPPVFIDGPSLYHAHVLALSNWFLCHLLCATLGSLYPCSRLSSFALAVPHFEGAFLAAGCLQTAKLVHLFFTHSPHGRVTYAVCFSWAAEAKC